MSRGIEPSNARDKRLSGLSMGRKHTYATNAQLETLVRRMHRSGILYYEAVEEFKKQFILVVLRHVNWNKSKAARALEMHRSTLVRILRELNIDVRNPPQCRTPSPIRH